MSSESIRSGSRQRLWSNSIITPAPPAPGRVSCAPARTRCHREVVRGVITGDRLATGDRVSGRVVSMDMQAAAFLIAPTPSADNASLPKSRRDRAASHQAAVSDGRLLSSSTASVCRLLLFRGSASIIDGAEPRRRPGSRCLPEAAEHASRSLESHQGPGVARVVPTRNGPPRCTVW